MNTRITKELTEALDAASERTASPELFLDEQTRGYVGVERLHDDSIITFTGPQKKVTEVHAYNPDELKDLLSDPLLWCNEPVPTRLIDQIVRHETQHSEAAAKLAATGTCFGIDIVSKTDDSVSFTPFFRLDEVQTTKLGMATICAHPVDPSPKDISDINKLGFTGPSDVARRALDHNYAVLSGKKEGLYLPVSLACNGLALSYADEKNSRYGYGGLYSHRAPQEPGLLSLSLADLDLRDL